MAALGKILLVLLALVVAFVVTIAAASEFGGEVVTLYTRDSSGNEVGTSLWVVDTGGFQYLRAGDRSAGWFERLRREPAVRVERGGKAASYQALPTPDMTRTIDQLMAEKYGLADRVVSIIRDPESSMAVRLVPATS
jgi:hypothetical protein